MSTNTVNDPPVRVLLAEDNAAYAQLLTILLGMRDDIDLVGHASDGAEAVALARHHRPDVVLMDLHMPNLDGAEATRRIRGELESVRVVMLTSSNDPRDARRARDAGAAEYLTKDCREAELLGAITGTASAASPAPRFCRVYEWAKNSFHNDGCAAVTH